MASYNFQTDCKSISARGSNSVSNHKFGKYGTRWEIFKKNSKIGLDPERIYNPTYADPNHPYLNRHTDGVRTRFQNYIYNETYIMLRCNMFCWCNIVLLGIASGLAANLEFPEVPWKEKLELRRLAKPFILKTVNFGSALIRFHSEASSFFCSVAVVVIVERLFNCNKVRASVVHRLCSSFHLNTVILYFQVMGGMLLWSHHRSFVYSAYHPILFTYDRQDLGKSHRLLWGSRCFIYILLHLWWASLLLLRISPGLTLSQWLWSHFLCRIVGTIHRHHHVPLMFSKYSLFRLQILR